MSTDFSCSETGAFSRSEEVSIRNKFVDSCPVIFKFLFESGTSSQAVKRQGKRRNLKENSRKMLYSWAP